MFTSFVLLGQKKYPIVQSNCTNKKSTQLEVIVEDLRERMNRGNKLAYIGLRCGVVSMDGDFDYAQSPTGFAQSPFDYAQSPIIVSYSNRQFQLASSTANWLC